MAKTIAENSPEERIPKPTSRGKKDGLNYTAIAIMLMFVLPAVVAGVTQVYLQMH